MIVSVIGARPQFIKAAVVSAALAKNGICEMLVHTGQHYDEKMSAVFWKELKLPEYKINLDVGSGTHGGQTASMIEKLEKFLLNQGTKVKALLLYGDTNSTLAGSIVASKLQLPIIHIEAGLRSFNRSMPEEINRIVTDHLSSVLFCSSEDAVLQLSKEGISKNVYNVGDVMYDALLTFSKLADNHVKLSDVISLLPGSYQLLTLHRPTNTANNESLQRILTAIKTLNVPTIWPVHPRLKDKIASFPIPDCLYISEPLSYFEMMVVLKNCFRVLTDSGGLQKEAYWMRKQCITLREETEWVETLHNYWNALAGADEERITKAASVTPDPESWKILYGNGNAADKIAEVLKQIL